MCKHIALQFDEDCSLGSREVNKRVCDFRRVTVKLHFNTRRDCTHIQHMAGQWCISPLLQKCHTAQINKPKSTSTHGALHSLRVISIEWALVLQSPKQDRGASIHGKCQSVENRFVGVQDTIRIKDCSHSLYGMWYRIFTLENKRLLSHSGTLMRDTHAYADRFCVNMMSLLF